MRQCPFPGCQQRIPGDKFACAHHWYSLTPAQQRQIHAAYTSYQTGEIGVEQLRQIQGEVIAQVQAQGPKVAKCSSCSAAIVWAKTAAGKATPLDAQPNEEKGNVVLKPDGSAEVLTGEELADARAAKIPLYLSHFATCPAARRHRKAQ